MPNENENKSPSAMTVTDKQTTLAQYGSFDLEEMQKTAEDLPSGGGKYFKPRQGKNVVRFLPPAQGRKATFIWYKHYFGLGDERKAIICTKYQFNEPCPVCQRAAKLRASGNKIDAKKARAFDPQAKVYANIVDMNEPEKGVQVWEMGQGLFKDIMSAIEMANVGKIFAHPEKGYNVVFKRIGEGKATEYKGHQVDREPSELPDWQELLPQQMDIENAEAAPTDEEVDDALDGEFEERTSRREGKGKGRGRGNERSAAKRDDPNYDDEEDAELVDDDDDKSDIPR